MDYFVDRALQHLQALCNRAPDRSVGSAGNRAATTYFTRTLESLGLHVTLGTFECNDWDTEGARLQGMGSPRAVYPSPYGRGGNIEAPLVVASTLEELKTSQITGKILLLKGRIAAYPLTPKNYPFYNPEEHQNIYKALEAGNPAAIITATPMNPPITGALYPCPLFEDGDLEIPTVYMTAEDGEILSAQEGLGFQLIIKSRQLPSRGSNVCGQVGDIQGKTVLICAHIDTKKGSPGALDNATGVATLLLTAELLADYTGPWNLEFVALNGEDYYSAPGQVLFLETFKDSLDKIKMAINLDGVALKNENQAFSFYGIPKEKEYQLRQFLSSQPDLKEGPSWMEGDHSIFIQRNIPALAFTCTNAQSRLLCQIAHTPEDTVDLADPSKIYELAKSLAEMIRQAL